MVKLMDANAQWTCQRDMREAMVAIFVLSPYDLLTSQSDRALLDEHEASDKHSRYHDRDALTQQHAWRGVMARLRATVRVRARARARGSELP